MSTIHRVRKAAQKGDYYTDVPMSNVAVSRFQKLTNFVAPFAAARLIVNKPSGKIDAWDMAAINRDDMHDRGENDRARETFFKKTAVDFAVPTKSIAVKLNDLVQKAADVQVNPRTMVPKVLSLKAAIRLERQLAAKMTSANWYRTVTGVTGSEANLTGGVAGDRKKWTESADPLPGIAQEIENQGKLTGIEPTGMIFGRQAWRALRYHAEIRAALTSGGTPVVRNRPASLEEMAQLLELEWCGVSKGIVNTAGLNLPAVNDYCIPGASALLYFRPTAGGGEDPGVYNNEEAAALARLVYADGAGNNDGIRIRALRDEFAGSGGSDHWEIDSFNDYQVLTSEMGTLWESMV